jgi:tetratricopeptide (TPR) repeat protein
MDRVEKTVFLSYRRTNIPWALAIFQNLTQHGFDVFFDYNGIASGDFERVILGNINSRAHFVVLLTPSALERCHELGDWLRREIEAAMAEQRNIVPLFLEGFSFASTGIADQLTGALGEIRKYNGLNIPPDYFDEAMERLRSKYLNVPLTAVLHPASPSAQQAAIEHKAAADAAPEVTTSELTAQQWFEFGLEASDLDEKILAYSEAIRLKPDFADAFNNRGNTRYSKGEMDGAIEDYTEAIRLKPDHADAFHSRGLARVSEGDRDSAIKDYSQAIRLKPDFSLAFLSRGNARCDNGDFDGAMKDYDDAIRLKPGAYAFFIRGLAREETKNLNGAIEDYNEAIRLNPEFAEAFNSRGRVRYAMMDRDGATRDYNEAIRLKPNYAEALRNRGDAHFDQFELDEAIREYNEAIRFKPNFAEALLLRGRARRENGDLDGAMEDFNEALRVKPDSEDVFYYRANVWEQKGEFAAAISDYQKYFDLTGQKKWLEKIRDLKKKL